MTDANQLESLLWELLKQIAKRLPVPDAQFIQLPWDSSNSLQVVTRVLVVFVTSLVVLLGPTGLEHKREADRHRQRQGPRKASFETGEP